MEQRWDMVTFPKKRRSKLLLAAPAAETCVGTRCRCFWSATHVSACVAKALVLQPAPSFVAPLLSRDLSYSQIISLAWISHMACSELWYRYPGAGALSGYGTQNCNILTNSLFFGLYVSIVISNYSKRSQFAVPV